MESKVAAQSPPSDTDGGERPVRQQLRETNLNSVDQSNGSTQTNRKRSFDNTDGAADARPTKRSRECTPDNATGSHKTSTEAKSNPTDAAAEDVSDSELASEPDFIPLPKEHECPKEYQYPKEYEYPEEQKIPAWCEPGIYGSDIDPADRTITIQLPLTLDIKIGFAGAEQTKRLTFPLAFEIDGATGDIDLVEPVSVPGMRDYQKADSAAPAASPPAPSLGAIPSSPPIHGPNSPAHPKHRQPTVEAHRSDSESPQTSKSTTRSNEDDPQSLKKKRSREQLEADASNNLNAATEPASSSTEPTAPKEKPVAEQPATEQSAAEGQPEKKKPRDNSEERKTKVDQTFTESAFGKASAGSPFALNTSNSAASPFAMSSTKSAFGASPFATSGASTTGFGSLGQTGFSAFGSFTQSHGKLSNFGSSNAPASFSGTAGKLTSFASPNAPASFSDSKDKTLGAAKSDDEESDNEKDGEADDTFVAEKTDERFHEHTIETGEENESNEFSAKGKLYYFDDKKWKERGAGTFKVNSKTDPDGKKSARMIMRADGAHRVMLNSAIWKSMPFGVKGQRPTTKDIYLASKEDNKVSTLLLRLGNEKQTGELYEVLEELVGEI